MEWQTKEPLRVVVDIETLYDFEKGVLDKFGQLYPRKKDNVFNEYAKPSSTHPHLIYNFSSRKTRVNLTAIYEEVSSPFLQM